MQNIDQGEQPPYRRRVFYIPGYDPFHPRRYRELYRKEAQIQAGLSGYHIEQHAKKTDSGFGWHVEAQIEGRHVQTDFDVLLWSDIVRASMSSSIFLTYCQLLRTAWIYIGSGAFGAMMKLRKGPMIAGLYPAIFLLGQLLIACALGWIGGRVLASFSHWIFGVILGCGIIWAVLHWFRRQDRRIFAWYLMHDYSYSGQFRGVMPAPLHHRMREFGDKVRAALDQDYDEVLVIGHSSGTHIGVSLMASLWRDQAHVGKRPILSFLTLGQVVPMVSFLPKADELRQDLYDLSRQEQIFWLDVSAPGDGCSFALCDPVAVSGMASAQKVAPLVISAAFSQTLAPQTWKKLRWRWFRLHFQYLCAFDGLAGTADDYDYFRLTAGPQDLRGRYGARTPSHSRIERAVNPYGAVRDGR